MSDQSESDTEEQIADADVTGVSEDEFESRLGDEIREAGELLASDGDTPDGGPDRGWQTAAAIVEKVKPVPWLLWVQIRSVYGSSEKLGNPSPQTFSNIRNLILQAAQDENLVDEGHALNEFSTLTEAVDALGVDVAASVCLMHAVCRRVAIGVSERVWRPIVDDALLRASIGYQVGDLAPNIGRGRGMLAGFAGRCGLAVQIASGPVEHAQKALSGLASGVEIGKVCRDVYGCDPLQVTALTLIAGGCSRDIAMGIAAYHSGESKIPSGTEQYRWLRLFGAIERIRMGAQDEITEEEWALLEMPRAAQVELEKRVRTTQRRGHGWRWITQSLSELGGDDGLPRSPEDIRAAREKREAK